MSSQEEMLSAYFELMNLNGASHVYREAVRSGVLESLIAGPKTADEVAQACQLQVRPTDLLLRVLVALGLSKKEDRLYRATALAYVLLSGSYKNLGDEYWAHLPALLRSGNPLVKMDSPAQSEAHYQAQAAILGWMLTPAAHSAVPSLLQLLPPRAAILDVGAGSAIWSLTLAQATSDACVTAVDWPGVLPAAVENAQSLGLADRLTTLAGNYHDVEFPAGAFDLAILANIAHLESPDSNRMLLRKVRGALKTGGNIVIIDAFGGQERGELNHALYALGLALRTEHGRVYSALELEPMLLESGFRMPRLIPLEVPPYVVGMLIARRGD